MLVKCLYILSFNELLRKYVYSFRNRLVSSQNCILISICSSTMPLYSVIWVWCLHYNVQCNVILYILFILFNCNALKCSIIMCIFFITDRPMVSEINVYISQSHLPRPSSCVPLCILYTAVNMYS